MKRAPSGSPSQGGRASGSRGRPGSRSPAVSPKSSGASPSAKRVRKGSAGALNAASSSTGALAAKAGSPPAASSSAKASPAAASSAKASPAAASSAKASPAAASSAKAAPAVAASKASLLPADRKQRTALFRDKHQRVGRMDLVKELDNWWYPRILRKVLKVCPETGQTMEGYEPSDITCAKRFKHLAVLGRKQTGKSSLVRDYFSTVLQDTSQLVWLCPKIAQHKWFFGKGFRTSGGGAAASNDESVHLPSKQKWRGIARDVYGAGSALDEQEGINRMLLKELAAGIVRFMEYLKMGPAGNLLEGLDFADQPSLLDRVLERMDNEEKCKMDCCGGHSI